MEDDGFQTEQNWFQDRCDKVKKDRRGNDGSETTGRGAE